MSNRTRIVGPLLVAALGGLALLSAAATAAAAPIIHAHRGGSVIDGTPRFPENTLPAFANAAELGVVLELDVKLTQDGVPVVIHDATLDRTTNCTGAVEDRTLAQLGSCRADVLGSPGSRLPTEQVASPTVPVPTLADVLALARDRDARVNLEIKNIPTDGDFDATDAYANRVLDAVDASAIPRSLVLIQSFWPPNLDLAEGRGFETSLLTLAATNEGGPNFADGKGYEWVSPGFPVNQAYVSRAHALGLRVVPYTLDTPAEIKAAAALGVDEVITNDPGMARRALAEVEPDAPPIPPPPSDSQCRAARASRTLAPLESYDAKPGAPRVFAMQYKQEAGNVESYAAFRTKIECMILEYVEPRLARGRPNVVAFNEDVGLLTLGTGTRGRAARDIFARPGTAPGCADQGAPCGAVGALLTVRAGYSKEVTAYQSRFPTLPAPFGGTFVAATDTFARGWMQTFSDMARRYGVYILGSNNQAPFRESTDPAEIDTFRDPDLPRPASVFVATGERVFNEVFMWGPSDVRQEGPRPLKNVVAQNKKVPITSIEELVQLTNGPSTGPDAVENVRPYQLPGTQARISFATSLPAFVYGDPPAGTDPCSDTSRYYMRCLDKLGTNLVMQDEANPGEWADNGGGGYWQPLEWMRSTWRAASDPTVSFDYNVTPHMVGNLADLPFDGQTAITQRGLGGGAQSAGSGSARRCTYVGNSSFVEGEDPERARGDAGPKSEFLVLAPWVVPDGPRPQLREASDKLAAGSGDPLENDYLETVAVADLPFPPNPNRPGCVTSPAGAAPKLRLTVSPRTARTGRRTRFRFTVTAIVAGERREVEGAVVRFAGARSTSGSAGRATIVRRLRSPGTYRATATRLGFRRGAATVRGVRSGGRGGPGGRGGAGSRCARQRNDQRLSGRERQRCRRVGVARR